MASLPAVPTAGFIHRGARRAARRWEPWGSRGTGGTGSNWELLGAACAAAWLHARVSEALGAQRDPGSRPQAPHGVWERCFAHQAVTPRGLRPRVAVPGQGWTAMLGWFLLLPSQASA